MSVPSGHAFTRRDAEIAEAATAEPAIARALPRRPRSRLFRKYILLFVVLVGGTLLASGGVEIWFSYRENQLALARLQQEKALAAAARIELFIDEVTRQIGWTARAQWSSSVVDQRRIEYLQLLRQAPAVTEVAHLDAGGREELRVSRLAMDATGSRADFSGDPRFTEAKARKTWYSPVYFRKESEPYITVAIAGTGRDTGVTVAEVNLKFIWDVISRIKAGQAGYAYVVDSRGLLIAHPDIGLVLRKTDLGGLPQVAAVLPAGPSAGERTEAEIGADPAGRAVLTASAAIKPTDWNVFVDLPLSEALAPLYESAFRTAVVMLIGLGLAAAAGLLLARRMVVPIQALQEGAARIGGGDLSRRIDIRTGDELESLADQFNSMGERLQESYAGLERKVEERTSELARSIEELKALGVVGRAVSSTLDLRKVLDTVVVNAIELCAVEGCSIFRYKRSTGEFLLWHAVGLEPEVVDQIQALRVREHETVMGQAIRGHEPVEVPDLIAMPSMPLRDISVAAGYRAALIVPLVRADRVFGAIVLQRRREGGFAPSTISLLRTFASQSSLAIQNARLFREIEEKGRQLQVASQHKSQFLANMSHELRTPLNAILGYTELMLDGLYGELGDKPRGVLERVQANGRHLLGLINDVLDLAKIEAGQLTLAVDDYSVGAIVHSVVAATESLAEAKGLRLAAEVAPDLPAGRGDERRLTQVLLNIVGNAIKFTDKGSVTIAASAGNGFFTIAVADTGPGIPDADQARIFEEFQQVDNSSTRQKGGSGLGLAISRRIVEMHGGTITVESVPGQGATFRIHLPIDAAMAREVA